MHLLKAIALWAPVIITMTSLASMTVCTPTVNAILGTLLISFSKNLELAIIVSYANVFNLVRDYIFSNYEF